MSPYTHTRRTDGALRWTFALALGIIVLLQALDAITTLAAVRLGVHEWNPFVAFLLHQSPVVFIVAKALAATISTAFLLWIWRHEPRIAHIFAVICVLVSAIPPIGDVYALMSLFTH